MSSMLVTFCRCLQAEVTTSDEAPEREWSPSSNDTTMTEAVNVSFAWLPLAKALLKRCSWQLIARVCTWPGPDLD